MAMRMQEYKAPAAESEDIAGKTKDLTQTDDAYSGDLTEDGAKSLLAWRARGGDGPIVSKAKGSAKFWVKDGIITKYQYKLQGTMNFGGDDIDIDRTTTVEVKDVGADKVVVPNRSQGKGVLTALPLSAGCAPGSAGRGWLQKKRPVIDTSLFGIIPCLCR